MMAAWMCYAALLAALVGAVGACADAVLRMTGRASRLVWAAAIGVSLAAPVALAVRATTDAPRVAAATASAGSTDAALEAILARATVRSALAAPTLDWRTLDRPLLVVWLVASLVALGWLLLARRTLRRAARTWSPASVDGETVLVAPDVGPAALAEDGGRIVLPSWALGLDGRRRALLLAHERAHLAARDPQLVTAAAAAVALMPWNPALWWHYRRLRTAVEIDCDRRVLRRHPDVASYGALLLDVARRGTTDRHHLAAAFSAPTPATSLERRIRTMTSRRPRHLVVRALAVAALGTGLTVAACETPHPTGLKPTAQVPITQVRSTSPEQKAAGVDLVRIKETIDAQLPAVARGIGAPQLVYVVEDASGHIVKSAAGPAPARLTGTATRNEATARSKVALDDALGAIDANRIATVDVFKLAPGKIAPDSANVVWIRLKSPGEAAADGGLRAKISASGAETAIVRERHVDSAQYAVVRMRSAGSDSVRERAAGAVYRVENAKVRVLAEQPIYVIDGTEVAPTADGHSPLDGYKPDDLATVNVLKGERAVVEYGERARNGVIVVTTKHARTTRQY